MCEIFSGNSVVSKTGLQLCEIFSGNSVGSKWTSFRVNFFPENRLVEKGVPVYVIFWGFSRGGGGVF